MTDELYVPDEWPDKQDDDTPESELMPVFSVAGPLFSVERMIAHGVEEREEHPDKSLFVGLDPVELSLVQGGLYLMTVLYGRNLVAPLVKKLIDVIGAQEFCDCENCQRERDEKEAEDGSQDANDQ